MLSSSSFTLFDSFENFPPPFPPSTGFASSIRVTNNRQTRNADIRFSLGKFNVKTQLTRYCLLHLQKNWYNDGWKTRHLPILFFITCFSGGKEQDNTFNPRELITPGSFYPPVSFTDRAFDFVADWISSSLFEFFSPSFSSFNFLF